jgi:NAD(P)-dependent dehydrogenase (short-subunit alcohol dehydrogenase family)
MPSKKPGKITFKGKIDPRLIPTDGAPGYEIVGAKVTDTPVEVWLSDGRVIITPLSWYPTLEAASPKQRKAFDNLGIGLAWEDLDFHLSVEGMLAGAREFERPSHAVAWMIESARHMLNLNINVVMKNVHDVLPHMIERGTGDIVVTSSLAAHFPTPWEPVYASSKWAINCFVQTVRRQVFKHGIRFGSISPGPVISALLADWPEEKLKEAKEAGSLLEASEVPKVVMFMLTRPRGMTIRDVVMVPTNFDL